MHDYWNRLWNHEKAGGKCLQTDKWGYCNRTDFIGSIKKWTAIIMALQSEILFQNFMLSETICYERANEIFANGNYPEK